MEKLPKGWFCLVFFLKMTLIQNAFGAKELAHTQLQDVGGKKVSALTGVCGPLGETNPFGRGLGEGGWEGECYKPPWQHVSKNPLTGNPWSSPPLDVHACTAIYQNVFQISFRDFPEIFLENSRKDTRNSHGLLEFSAYSLPGSSDCWSEQRQGHPAPRWSSEAPSANAETNRQIAAATGAIDGWQARDWRAAPSLLSWGAGHGGDKARARKLGGGLLPILCVVHPHSAFLRKTYGSHWGKGKELSLTEQDEGSLPSSSYDDVSWAEFVVWVSASEERSFGKRGRFRKSIFLKF